MNEYVEEWEDTRRQPGQRGGAAALAVCALVVATIWLVLLPGMTRRPEIQSDLKRLRSQAINPSAMYYTELEMIGDVIDQNRRFQRQHPEAFWLP